MTEPKTMGDVYPHLKAKPGFEAIAASPWPARGQEPPGLIRKAANLAQAVVAHVANGCRRTTAEMASERERICRACPHLDQAADKCGKCGCVYMNAKRAMASSECPEGRWRAEP